MPKSKTDHENAKARKHEKAIISGFHFVLSCFRDPPCFVLESSIRRQTQLDGVSPILIDSDRD